MQRTSKATQRFKLGYVSWQTGPYLDYTTSKRKRFLTSLH